MNALELGLLGGTISGGATIFGASALFLSNLSIFKKLTQIKMDFVIGLMLAASAFSLIIPAFQQINQSHYTGVFLSLLIGVIFIRVISLYLNHFTKNLKNQKAVLFILAIMVHNFPEGLASGGALSMSSTTEGQGLLAAIAFQNFPEGFTTAMSFLAIGLSPLYAFLGATVTGVVEILGGILGGYLSQEINGVLPYIMSFAGGAMMSVTLVELLDKIKEESVSYFMKPSFLTGVGIILIFNKI